MTLMAALAAMGGAARREDLLAAGVTRHQLRTAMVKGKVVREHLGVYALPNASPAIVQARVFRGRVACVSACIAMGLPVLAEPRTTHLLVPQSRSNARPGIRLLDEVTLHRSHVHVPREADLTPAFSLDLAGQCVTGPQQLVLVDAALSKGLLTHEELWEFRQTSPARRRWLVEHACAQSESPIETLARLAVTRAGLHVVPQARIDGVGRVDLLVEGWVVVELDGREYHSGSRRFQEDRSRDRALVQAGFVVLRFTFRDVVYGTSAMVEEIRAVLRLRHRPSAPAL